MVVVVAKHIPPAVRGRMKLWFIEPRPNVFISGITDSVATQVITYLFSHCPISSELLVFQKIPSPPYYKIWSKGNTNKMTIISGLQLILEKTE
ncbi:type I-E CRISPR-associated endoribonuclease Cas2e [Parasphaerochaeta coccoides]|uniref:CRISPR-associated protein, Cas2 family n=1 Tax=Parasphaerochaeta coccoides (strain ATCC BAA-1237 / DSM 17374 / SPN1) TaxID=760011 RepID=F4GL13_PARC1|nr:type I-E CRISPR-associated endoribonuclease Cas2e [Parasphaerochaeta coccoides]AEC02353.1 CRISPR-associated protein, Cas2 family [Parasphaerochaeta coccoides DSM 17374]